VVYLIGAFGCGSSALCRIAELYSAALRTYGIPFEFGELRIANPRYSRLKICATADNLDEGGMRP